MRERKSNMQGDIVRMEALNAGQNIGATNYIDQDDFYPATGITENEEGDIDTIDMVYDHRENDLTSSADFFDGDYQNSYANGEEDDEFDDDDEDYDEFDDEDEYDFDDDDDYEDFDDEEDYDDFDDDDYDEFDDDDEYDNYDGIDPEDTEAEWGEFDGEDDIDMDESIGDYNDLPSGSFDFFDGGDPELDVDYNGFDSDTFSEIRGRRRNAGRTAEKVMSYTPLGMAKKAMDARFSEEGQKRAEERRERRRAKREDRQEERKERREGRKSAREEKREERQERRRSRKDERQELRAKKKLAKIGEVEARNEATRALSQQPTEDPATAQIMADLTKKSANTQPQKKGMSTGAIVGISLGALAVVGTALFLILRKK